MAGPYDDYTLELARRMALEYGTGAYGDDGAGGAGGEYTPPGTEYMRSEYTPVGTEYLHSSPADLAASAAQAPSGAGGAPPMPVASGAGGAPVAPGAQGAAAAAPDPMQVAPMSGGIMPMSMRSPLADDPEHMNRVVLPYGPGGETAAAAMPRPVVAPQRRGLLPQHMRRAPAPPPIPPQFHEGQYYPGGNEIELARLRGDITDEQARAAEAGRERWQHTVPGLGAQMSRQQLANEAAQLDTMQPYFDAQLAEGQARQEQLQRLQDFYRAEQMAQQERDEARRQEIRKQEDSYRLALQDIANTKIDPNRLTATGGQQFARALRGALGALGAALLGRPNETAVDMAREIDRDIEAQRKNLQTKKEGAEAQRSILGVMRQRYEDDEMAAAAARKWYFEQLDAELAGKAAETADAQMRSNIDLLRQELGQRAELNELALRQQGQARADAIAQQRAMMLLQAQQARARKGASGRDLDARYVVGYGVAPTPDSAKAMREALGSTKAGQETIDQLLALSERGMKSADPTARAKAQALSSMLKIQVNKAGGLGALDAGSLELIDSMVADPTRALTLDSSNRARLNTLRSHFDRQLNSRAQATGFVPARRNLTEKGAEYVYGESPGRAPTAARFKPIQ